MAFRKGGRLRLKSQDPIHSDIGSYIAAFGERRQKPNQDRGVCLVLFGVFALTSCSFVFSLLVLKDRKNAIIPPVTWHATPPHGNGFMAVPFMLEPGMEKDTRFQKKREEWAVLCIYSGGRICGIE
jgi:hypothetical protein